jgi:hypothetical protein
MQWESVKMDMGQEEEESRPREGCVGLLTDEEYAAVLLARQMQRQKAGTYAKHDKQLQEDGKCEKNDREDYVWNADL